MDLKSTAARCTGVPCEPDAEFQKTVNQSKAILKDVALAEKFGLPVHFIGVGEGAEDLRPFTARSFARSLMGLNPRD